MFLSLDWKRKQSSLRVCSTSSQYSSDAKKNYLHIPCPQSQSSDHKKAIRLTRLGLRIVDLCWLFSVIFMSFRCGFQENWLHNFLGDWSQAYCLPFAIRLCLQQWWKLLLCKIMQRKQVMFYCPQASENRAVFNSLVHRGYFVLRPWG